MRYRSLGLAALLVLVAIPARADEDIPTFVVLTCEKDCPPHTPAKLLTTQRPFYPVQYRGRFNLYAEAMVDIDYTIAAEGTVKGAVVENLLGPHEFVDAALESINARTYEPATEGGKPVDENHRVRFLFTISDGGRGGRTAVVREYGEALAAARSGDTAGAIAQLKGIGARPELNFYERTMAAYALALLEAKAGDNLAARDAIRIATIEKGRHLDPKTTADALRLRIKLEAICGDFAEAFAWHDILMTAYPLLVDDKDADLVAKLHAAIAAPEPLAMPGKIPDAGGTSAFWQHTLLRRGFEFHNVTGKLDSFELRCQRHGIRSPVSDKANWTIPASWTGCFINVSGAPGTTFSLVEVAPAIAGDPRPVEP